MSRIKYIQREYDPDGNFVQATEHDPVVDVSTMAEWPAKGMFINADMQRTITPAYRQQAVNVVFQADNELIKEGHFPASAFSAGQPLYWMGEAQVEMIDIDALGLGTTIRRGTTGTDGVYRTPARFGLGNSGQFAMGFAGNPVLKPEDAKSRASDPAFILWEQDMEMQISFDYFMRSIVGYYKVDCLLYFEVQAGEYYLSAEPLQWQKARKKNPIFISVNDFDAWKTYKIKTPVVPEFTNRSPLPGFELPPERPVSIRVYQPVLYSAGVAPMFEHLVRQVLETNVGAQIILDNVSARLLYRGSLPREEDRRTYLNDAAYTQVPEELVIYHADVPEYRNRELIYPYAWRVTLPGQPPRLTSLWNRHGYPEAVKLVDLILQTVVDASRKPTAMIPGTINHVFSPSDYIRINYYGNRVFKINGYTWDARMRTVRVELLEVLTGLPLETRVILREDGGLVFAEINQNNEFIPLILE